MNDNLSKTRDLKETLQLKLPEPAVQENNPWADDALKRSDVAERLTNLISGQSASLVISLHGQWGTGKTFLLKRWQQQLEHDGFRAIYFNAWEDDFCDDPLVAIIGQLSGFLERGEQQELSGKIKKAVEPLLIQGAMSALHKVSGVNLDEILKQLADKTFEEYSRQGEKKNELKAALQELSGKVKAETGHPLIFIIDELDRCRPTFAIELLERVKHIFDIPDMVFVFGINRDELCSSIRSVYGEIDADIYLRRFFDMEFSLPDIDPEAFCKILIERYQLEQFFTRMSETTGDTAYYHNFEWFSSRPFPALCSHFGLSLRDIDYCVRMIVFIGKNVTAQDSMSQPLLSLLVVLRLKNKTLYQEYIRGDRMGSEVVNYIDKLVPPDNRVQELEATFDELEIDLYLADRTQREGRSKAMDEFARLYQNLKEERATPHTVYLSERTQKSDTERIERLNSIIQEYRQFRGNIRYFSKRLITRLSGLIELSQSFVRA
ncbi:MAG: P-loop NTPase fold protein [Gammaproteobacteria bacterium]|nr:P-loop NTPase fold protein [Gammaproteobacteria bacterium]